MYIDVHIHIVFVVIFFSILLIVFLHRCFKNKKYLVPINEVRAVFISRYPVDIINYEILFYWVLYTHRAK